MKTAVEMCNDALRILGLRTDCTDITTPGPSESDKVFSSIFSQVRRMAIKRYRPRFACIEAFQVAGTPIDPLDLTKGYKFYKPSNCLLVQKVDGQEKFTQYENLIVPMYQTAPSVITINFIKDEIRTAMWSDEFDVLMSALLAKRACLFLTKDITAYNSANAAVSDATREFNVDNMRDAMIKKRGIYREKHYMPFPYRKG